MASHAHHHEPGQDVVYGQYETIEQQQESYVVGMWTFLVTEVMFFGGLFLVYTLYRWKYADVWFKMSEHLNWKLGAVNTTVLLFSSFTVAMAVQKAQKRETKAQMRYLFITILCAATFLVIKYFEYSEKIRTHLYPDWNFNPMQEIHKLATDQVGPAKLYMSLYFAMTGLHGVHVLVGIIVIATLMIMTKAKAPSVTDYIPTEMVGLYWHFVDLVWIFLYPLFYLIPA
jgi:cytochrome c oxidase subunit 3